MVTVRFGRSADGERDETDSPPTSRKSNSGSPLRDRFLTPGAVTNLQYFTPLSSARTVRTDPGVSPAPKPDIRRLVTAKDGKQLANKPSSRALEAKEPGIGSPQQQQELAQLLPLSMLNYVLRTQQARILNDVQADKQCAKDPFVIKHRPQSMCASKLFCCVI